MKVEDFLARLQGVRRSGKGWTARCPAHDDAQASLSIAAGDDGRVLLKCFAGCRAEAVVTALGLKLRDLFPRAGQRRDGRGTTPKKLPLNGRTVEHPPGLTLSSLAEAKRISPDFLRELGLTDFKYRGTPAVRVPYHTCDGNEIAVRFRLSLGGPRRFLWRSGDKPLLYGLDRLKTIREAGWVLLVEGESDCWTAWLHKVPALGIPGKASWRSVWREHLEGLHVYLWQEPGAEDLVLRVAADVPGLHIIPDQNGMKDLSEAHLRGHEVVRLLEQLKADAIPLERLRREREDARVAELRVRACPVLKANDPLVLVIEGIQTLGYGGDSKPAIITYLSATSRLLKMRPGSMPVHLVIVGVPSAGKSYTLRLVLLLLPPEAYHLIDAGSSRVLIYDEADLRHRIVVFSEADSLPAGEDNPAASAVRNLLQDHRLSYKVVMRDPDTGDYRVREVVKPGPTVLITTAVRRLGQQLDTRVFSLDIPDDLGQLRQALAVQATLETEGAQEPAPALVAFQAYLQARAPWDVIVPFAPRLAEAISRSMVAPRILRDFNRLLSLIKATTILRHRWRQIDPNGRLVAEIEDYRAVYDLINDMYEATVSGASQGVRDAVRAVEQLRRSGTVPVSVTKVAGHLRIGKASASRRIRAAVKEGWLVNTENRKGYSATLDLGEPLPEPGGLPTPESLGMCSTVSALTGGSLQGDSPTRDAGGDARGSREPVSVGGGDYPAAWDEV